MFVTALSLSWHLKSKSTVEDFLLLKFNPFIDGTQIVDGSASWEMTTVFLAEKVPFKFRTYKFWSRHNAHRQKYVKWHLMCKYGRKRLKNSVFRVYSGVFIVAFVFNNWYLPLDPFQSGQFQFHEFLFVA